MESGIHEMYVEYGIRNFSKVCRLFHVIYLSDDGAEFREFLAVGHGHGLEPAYGLVL